MAMLPMGLLGTLSLITLGRDTASVFHVLATGCLIVAIVLLVGLLISLAK